jgi:hypothetical protein
MRIGKCPVPIPTGTTTSSQAGKEIKVWLYDWKAFVLPEDLILLGFPRKQDNKFVLKREERRREQEENRPSKRKVNFWGN